MDALPRVGYRALVPGLPALHLVRPHAGGRIRDTHITAVGHFPRRTHPGTDARFGYRSLVVVVAGSGVFHDPDGRLLPVMPPAAWCLRPGPRFTYGPPPGQWWEEYFIDLAGEGLARWQARGWLWDELAPAPCGAVGPVVSALQTILTHAAAGTPADADRAVLALERLLCELQLARSQPAGSPAAPAAAPAIQAAINLLHQRYDRDISWQRLAAEVGTSLTTLRRGIVRLTGMAPATYLRHLRLTLAVRHLRETALPVQAVARAVGYPSPDVFTRLFRRAHGVSPAAFRAQHRP